MKILETPISVAELKVMSQKMAGTIVKAVADIEMGTIVVDAELHADQEALLLETGSKQKNLWGFNLRPDHFGTDKFIVFDSMINIRPGQGNSTRGINNVEIQKRIRNLVDQAVTA